MSTRLAAEQAYERRYAEWRDSTSHPALFGRIALAWDEHGELALRMLNPDSGVFAPADWYVARAILPELLARHLGGNYQSD